MIERGGNQAQIPLFDEIPEELKHKKADILRTFDGSIEGRGITMTLNPITGEIIRARLFDLLSGKVVGYEPLARGKWVSPTHDIKEGSPEYEKLDRVYQDVRDKFMLWKVAHPNPGPLREWTVIKGKSYENSSGPKIILPEKWFEEEKPKEVAIEKAPVDLVVNADDAPKEAMQRERTTHKKLTRPRTGLVTRSNTRHSDTISSKEGPKMADARPAPAGLRRNSNKARERVLLDKGSLGKRIRKVMGR